MKIVIERPVSLQSWRAVVATLLQGLQSSALASKQGSGRQGGNRQLMTPSAMAGGMAHHGLGKDDPEQAMRGVCALAHSVLDALNDQCPLRVTWEKAARVAGRELTPEPPPDVLRFMMCDKASRLMQSQYVEVGTAEAMAAEVRKREILALNAAERCLRVKLEDPTRKKFIVALMPLKLTALPTLAKLSEAATITDGLGVTSVVSASSPVQAMAAMRAALMAAWPEFDWSPLLAAEDDARALLLGKREGGLNPEVARSRAAQLWQEVTAHVESRADSFRLATTFPDATVTAEVRDLLDAKAMVA